MADGVHGPGTRTGTVLHQVDDRTPARTLVVDRSPGPARDWVVMLSGTPWQSGAHRQHALARELAGQYRVLFVDPPRQLPDWSPGFELVGDGIWHATPPTGLPIGRQLPPANRLNRWLTANWLRRELNRYPGARLLWIDEDRAAPIIGQLDEVAVIYDASDLDWPFTRRWNRWHSRAGLRAAVRAADLVLTSSPALPERLPLPARPAESGRALLLPNGCDPDRFTPDGPTPGWVDALPRPLLGYLGAVDTRAFDANLVAALARAHPDWTILLVGPATLAGRAPLAGLPNVRLAGPVPFAEAPGIVRACDAGIIPYRLGGLVDHVHPKNCYEYLAAGKPVVATPLPALRPMAGLVRLAASAPAFGAAVQTALATARCPEAVARRRAAAVANSWARRGDQLRPLLDQLRTSR